MVGMDFMNARHATNGSPSTAEGFRAGSAIHPGDMIAPAGLYASDKDMFVFMVNEDKPISGPDGNTLYRGFFAENSEVGDRSYELTAFLYNAVCGNHIVWGAQNIMNVRIVHVGNAEERSRAAMIAGVQSYGDRASKDDEAIIRRAFGMKIADSKDEVIDALYKRRLPGVTTGDLDDAYEAAVAHPEDGHRGANTVWGMVQWITRSSQAKPNTDKRCDLDRAAGRVLQMAF